jgi:hypothetical protein
MKPVSLYGCLLAANDIRVEGAAWSSFSMHKDTVTVVAHGQEYNLADQQVALDENGTCDTVDIDGNHVAFTFRVNRAMKSGDL